MKPIISPLKPQMHGPDVAGLHEALTLLGFPIADAEKTSQRYGASTRQAVNKFQTDRQLAATGVVDEATSDAINGLLGEQGALDQNIPDIPDIPVPVGRRVAGTVLHGDGSAISGMLVQAFHRQVGGELSLGVETVTNDRGRYTITYLLPGGISKIDLFVRAYDDKQAIVAVSPIIIGAREQEVLDLSVIDPKYRGPSEFARATEALGPQVAGVKLDELDADDVALLVRNTGVLRVHVTAWIASKRLSERSGLAHEVLYGLVRTENTASLPRLLGRSRSRLRADLLSAADANTISRAAGDAADAAVVALKRAAAALSASLETPGSLGRLLATSDKASAEQQRIFLERYANYEGPVRDFWGQLRKDPGFGDEAVVDLQLTLQLGTLTANHPPLVRALRTRGVTRSSETARFMPQDWLGLLQSQIDGQAVGTPANIKGATEVERFENYTRLLTESAGLAFPTGRVAQALTTTPGWERSTAVAFLDANPAFNIKTANIKATLAAAGTVLEPGWDRAALEAELSAVQRIARIAPAGSEDAVTSGLLTKGYASGFSISRKSLSSFTRQTSGVLGGDAAARAVYQNAQFQFSRALNAYGLMHPIVAGPTFAAIGTLSAAWSVAAGETSTPVTSDPTWASLFGSVDYCGCEHCRSIYSPAAYFVDLLAWLDSHELDGQTAFDVLNARRPDLQTIELSCINTNTVLPYVDLVNEVLEARVLNGALPQATTATAAELLANPQFLYPEAYDAHLSQAVYPYVLPFDLWGDLGQAYLTHLGVRRADLMRALQRDGTPSNDAISAVQLGLSTPQWNIIIDADGHSVSGILGLCLRGPGRRELQDQTGGSLALPGARRNRIRRSARLAPLPLRQSQPHRDHRRGMRHRCDDTGDPHQRRPAPDASLPRLWRNRGVSMLDLDKVLHGLNVSTLGPIGMRWLADLDRLQAITNAPLLEILSWWSVMDTFEDRAEKSEPVKSLYERVFLNRAVDAAAGDDGFPLALNDARD